MLAAVPSAAAAAATDGQWVLIDQQPAGQTLVTLNPPSAGGDVGLRTLHTAPAGVALDAPQWSPDGNRIVFVEGARLRLYDLARGSVSDVAPEGTSPSWSADGTRIAFLRGGALLTRAPDGSGEQTLPIDATGVRDVAWSPDGAWFALWLGDRLDIVGVDGSEREPFDDGVRGGVAWAPDGSSLVYPRQRGEHVTLWEVREADEGPVGLSGAPSDPEFSPSGTTVVYTRTTEGVRELAWDANGSHSAIRMGGFVPAQPDWQPCVAGATVSCRSVTPLPPLRPLSCHSLMSVITLTQARLTRVPQRCPGAVSFELVTPPAHGTVTTGPFLSYQSAAGYVGPDSFTYRALGAEGRTSEVVRVDLNVIPPWVKPGAPKLTLAAGVLKLDKRGRVTVRGTCDRECVVRLRVRVKLTSGRIVNGRLVRARASAGGQVKLVLQRGKLPPRRKVAWARVSGAAVGADGRERAVKLTLR